jgi:ribonucleoside-diphosphate reductase alpha chain
VPVAQLAARFADRPAASAPTAAPTPTVSGAAASGVRATCPECGARALRKVDGCTRCEECHYMGGCG